MLYAEIAKQTLVHYAKLTTDNGQVYPEILQDLLADLRHYCYENGLNFDDFLKISLTNFYKERG